MRKTISTYWPVAILLPIALAFYLQAHQGDASTRMHEQTDVSAELARAVSLGYVQPDDASAAAIVMPASKPL